MRETLAAPAAGDISIATAEAHRAGYATAEAALAGVLQSCISLTTVNVDAGFVAGAQTGLVARTFSEARK
jgi:NCAIR mutase (PurE)-related protein